MIKVGMKVKRTNGYRFSNDEYVVTVSKIEHDHDRMKVWFKETGTYLDIESVEPVEPIDPVEIIIGRLKAQRDVLKTKLDDIDRTIKVLESI